MSPAPKPLVLTQHAQDAVEERELEMGWIESVVHAPEWAYPDPRRPGVERRFGSIPAHGNRILRVACYETPAEIRILTAFFDRGATRPS